MRFGGGRSNAANSAMFADARSRRGNTDRAGFTNLGTELNESITGGVNNLFHMN